MLNIQLTMSGPNVVWHGKLKELDREGTQRRPVGIVLRMTWKVLACPKRMCSLGINGEGELRGNWLTRFTWKMAVKTVCVWWWWFDLSFECLSSKIQNGGILVPAYLDCFGKWLLNESHLCKCFHIVDGWLESHPACKERCCISCIGFPLGDLA